MNPAVRFDLPDLRSKVEKAVGEAPIVDLHTHLFAPAFSDQNLWGIDELLTYHYLVAELLRVHPISPEQFFDLRKAEQADLVWEHLFVRRSPLSEATVGVTTVLTRFGLNPRAGNLDEARAFYSVQDATFQINHILELSGVSHVTMTNDPLDPIERQVWDRGAEIDSRFLPVLRIDPILNSWPATRAILANEGYAVQPDINEATIAEVRRFIDHWVSRMGARYVAVSLPSDFEYPHDSPRARLIDRAVLPACRDHKIPFAVMIGVRRGVNPRLRSAGDGMGIADLSTIERLAEYHPENRFLVTALARENAQGLCVAARKFSNILPFGYWWFMNNPSLVEEVTLMRLEMLGATFVPQHSDARVFDQLIYKWDHSRRSIAAALVKRYEAIALAGRPPTDAEIKKDATALMAGIAGEWLGILA